MQTSHSADSSILQPLENDIESSSANRLKSAENRLRRVREELKKARTEAERYRDMFIRERADAENLVKAKDREISSTKKTASANLMKNILPVLDSMDSAIQSSEANSGLIPIRDQALSLLGSSGLEPIKSVGEPFNPYLHEVVATTKEGEDGRVVVEVQKGYKLNGEVLRYAKVIVSKRE
ncbi:MAG: nucleotide exchange factor GrpE [Thermoplasmataceae archaeon]